MCDVLCFLCFGSGAASKYPAFCFVQDAGQRADNAAMIAKYERAQSLIDKLLRDLNGLDRPGRVPDEWGVRRYEPSTLQALVRLKDWTALKLAMMRSGIYHYWVTECGASPQAAAYV